MSQTEWFLFCLGVCVCVVFFCMSEMVLYTVSMHVSQPLPSGPFALAVGDCGATAQLDDHLLAVVEGPLVSQLLQGASRIR